VHGGVAAVLDPPKVRQVFLASDGGMWTLGSVAEAVGPSFSGDGMTAGFACEDTLSLASETIGFGGRS